MAVVDGAGETVWQQPAGSNIHDFQLLPNGNILTLMVRLSLSRGPTHIHPAGGFRAQSITFIVEVTRDNLVVWSYDSATANGNADYEIEVHGVQRLENGLTMIAESGRARIIEVDQAGEIRHEVALKVNHPPHPHLL